MKTRVGTFRELTDVEQARAKRIWSRVDRCDLCPSCGLTVPPARLDRFCETHVSWSCDFRHHFACSECEVEWVVIPREACKADMKRERSDG